MGGVLWQHVNKPALERAFSHACPSVFSDLRGRARNHFVFCGAHLAARELGAGKRRCDSDSRDSDLEAMALQFHLGDRHAGRDQLDLQWCLTVPARVLAPRTEGARVMAIFLPFAETRRRLEASL